MPCAAAEHPRVPGTREGGETSGSGSAHALCAMVRGGRSLAPPRRIHQQGAALTRCCTPTACEGEMRRTWQRGCACRPFARHCGRQTRYRRRTHQCAGYCTGIARSCCPTIAQCHSVELSDKRHGVHAGQEDRAARAPRFSRTNSASRIDSADMPYSSDSPFWSRGRRRGPPLPRSHLDQGSYIWEVSTPLVT